MIRGRLVKFEPTDKGITVTIKASDEEVQRIVNLYKQDVVIFTASECSEETIEYPSEVKEQVKTIATMIDDLLEALK